MILGGMDALTSIKLQIAWGADEAIGDTPIDRTGSGPRIAPTRMLVTPASGMPARATLVSLAEDCANAAASREALRTALAAFTACPLAATATNLVFADGNPSASVVIVDDSPGPQEDLTGKPMVGQAGQLLGRMLASIGLDRTSVLITNLIPWRPPGGRAPTETETAMCLPFLRRHLALLRPSIVVTLGTAPTQALSGNGPTIRRLRGRWQTITLPGVPESLRLLPMAHPSTLLKTPAAKKDAWTDLLALQEALDEVQAR